MRTRATLHMEEPFQLFQTLRNQRQTRTLAAEFSGVPVATIKKHATGKGSADKAAMVAAMRAQEFDPGDDNEADPLALLMWALDGLGQRTVCNPVVTGDNAMERTS